MAADIALACVMAAFLVAGAAVTASAAPRPRSVARVATRPSNGDGQVQAWGDIHADDGAGDRDGN